MSTMTRDTAHRKDRPPFTHPLFSTGTDCRFAVSSEAVFFFNVLCPLHIGFARFTVMRYNIVHNYKN